MSFCKHFANKFTYFEEGTSGNIYRNFFLDICQTAFEALIYKCTKPDSYCWKKGVEEGIQRKWISEIGFLLMTQEGQKEYTWVTREM